jgi:hypothetical protein
VVTVSKDASRSRLPRRISDLRFAEGMGAAVVAGAVVVALVVVYVRRRRGPHTSVG